MIEAAWQAHITGLGATFAVPAIEIGWLAIKNEDTLAVFNFSLHSAGSISTADRTRAASCDLVAIPDRDVSPVGLPPDAPIVCGVTVASIATIDSLVPLLVSRAGGTPVKHTELTKCRLDAEGAYRWSQLSRPATRTR